jgi:pimeloyl-ACP methyl ester carboxylesterase
VGAFRDLRVVEIAGAGHMVHFDRPDDLAATIREFL